MLLLLLLLDDNYFHELTQVLSVCCQLLCFDSVVRVALGQMHVCTMFFCQVRRIVSDYDDSVAAVAVFYDSGQDADSTAPLFENETKQEYWPALCLQ